MARLCHVAALLVLLGLLPLLSRASSAPRRAAAFGQTLSGGDAGGASTGQIQGRELQDNGSAPAGNSSCPAWPASALKNGGGPLLTGDINVYVIFYGNWEATAPCAPNSLSMLLYSLMMSRKSPNMVDWWKVVTKYCDATTGASVSPTVNIMEYIFDKSYSASIQLEGLLEGGRPSEGFNSVWQVFVNNLKGGALQQVNAAQGQPDPKGFYLILPSKEVSITGEQPCGWHSAVTYEGQDVAFGVVPQPGTGACTSSTNETESAAPTLNDCPSIDAIEGKILGLLAGTATNPHGSGWKDTSGADLVKACEAEGLSAVPGFVDFVQAPKIYDPETGSCTMS